MKPGALQILIVDDSPDDRLILRRHLARADSSTYCVTEAGRADEALAMCETAPPDCILLDYRLPDMDGLAALAAFRAQSDVPVVLLTGVGSEALAVEALQRGAQDYLVKGDLTPERLSLTLQQAVASARLTRERDQMRAQLSAVLEALPVGVAVLDADLRVSHANPALADILGQPAAALSGQALPALWPALVAPCARLQRGEPFSDLELGPPTADAADGRWLSVSGTPLGNVSQAGGLALLTIQDITARRRAESARLASEARFRAIIENGTEGVILLGPDLQPGYVSPTITSLLGHSPETFAALRARGLCHPDDQPRLAAFIATLTAQPGATAQVTTRLRHQDGTWRWIEQRGRNQTATPAIAGIIVSLRDVTERVLAEQAARVAQRAAAEALARLEALIRSVPSGIGYLDRELRYQLVNPALAALNGRAPEEHLGRTPHELLPGLAPRLEPIMRQVLATGEAARELELRGQRCPIDGEAHDWLISYFPVCDPTGAVTGVGVTVADITMSKRAEEELRVREEQLRLTLEAAELGVWRLDDVRGIVTLDARARAHFGVADETIPFPTLATRVHPEDLARVQREAQELRRIQHEGQIHTEYRVVHPDGSIHWLALHARYSFSGAGAERAIVGGYGTTQEITDRKAHEAALAAHAEALSRMNVELARALKLKDEFLALISHELRTPLNAVLGITELISVETYGPVSERQHKALATVVQSGQHLLAILNDILDLTHLESGNAALDVQAIDVDSLCRTALQFVQASAQAKGIQLVRTVAGDVEGLRGDERRLTQILTNLLDNAVKFTPPGGRAGLEVSVDAAEGSIALTVWDTGIGIAPEDMRRLFQPFTQVDGRLARSYEGIGLGLTLVRRLADMHGGSVSLESTPGQGSRFTVRLPWSQAENIAPPLPRGSQPTLSSWATPPRIVIADDHEYTLQLYAEFLGKQGCHVALARTGVEAVTQVRATRPDVAIVDVQMPELDGLSAIRQIRDDQGLGATPIIALTALAMPGDRERCLASGASAYLAKPVGLRTLIAAIAELLSRSPSGHAD